MPNEFLQYYSLFQQSQQNLANQALQSQSLALRGRQQALTEKGLALKEQELSMESMNQAVDTIGKLIGASDKLPEAQRGPALNSLIGTFNQVTGRNLGLLDVPDMKERFQQMSTFLESGDQESALDVISLTEMQSGKTLPNMRAKVAQFSLRGGQDFAPSESFDGAGVTAYTNIYKDFKAGGVIGEDGVGAGVENTTGREVTKVPNDLRDTLKLAYEKEQAHNRYVDNFSLLPPETQNAVFAYSQKRLLGLPVTDKEEFDAVMGNQFLETQEKIAKGTATPEDYRRNAEAAAAKGITDKLSPDDAATRVKIAEAESRIKLNEGKLNSYQSLVDHRAISNQILQAQLDMVPLEIQRKQAVIDKMKAGVDRDRELLKLRTQVVTHQQAFDKEKFLELVKKNEAEIANLNAETEHIKQDTQLTPAFRQAQIADINSRLAYREKLNDLFDAQIDYKQNGTAVARQRVDQAQQALALKEKEINGKLKKWQEGLATGQQDLKVIDQQRKQKLDHARELERLNGSMTEFVVNGGDIGDRQAVGKHLQQGGFGTVSIEEAQKAGGFKPASRLLLGRDEPTPAVKTGAQKTQDEGSFALGMLDELERTVNDDTIGGIGKLRSLVHGVGQQASAFGQKLTERAGSVVSEIAAGGEKNQVNPSRFFDKDLTEFELFSELAAYELAAAIANQEGRSLSDKDVDNWKRALGFQKTFTGKEQILASIEAARRLLRSRVKIADRRLQGKGPEADRVERPIEEMSINDILNELGGQ